MFEQSELTLESGLQFKWNPLESDKPKVNFGAKQYVDLATAETAIERVDPVIDVVTAYNRDKPELESLSFVAGEVTMEMVSIERVVTEGSQVSNEPSELVETLHQYDTVSWDGLTDWSQEL